MDATLSEGLGRLVNDAPHVDANCLMKKIIINGHPRLALFAKEDINPGKELRYDYGIKDLPWRKFKGMPKLYLGLGAEYVDVQIWPGTTLIPAYGPSCIECFRKA